MWALGNISGDSTTHRDIVLKHGALDALLKICNEPELPKDFVSKATWAISNLCRGQPAPSRDYVKAAIPALLFIIHSFKDDSEIISDALWALSSLSENEESLQIVISCHYAIRDLVDLLE